MVIALVLVSLVNSACEIPPPQLTSGALNATNDAAASQTVEATRTPGETLAPTDTATSTATATPAIVEVTVEKTQVGPEPTATPCPVGGICEVGPLLTPPPPGVIVVERGTYTPYKPQNARECAQASLDCPVQVTISAGFTVAIEGNVMNRDGWWWLCGRIITDPGPGGAQLCDHAMVWLSADGKKWGAWIRE